MTTASAPFRKARNMRSVLTRPVQGMRIVRKLAGYWDRMVPAISAAPYPHFQHRNAAIFGKNVILFTPSFIPLFRLIAHQYMVQIEDLGNIEA